MRRDDVACQRDYESPCQFRSGRDEPKKVWGELQARNRNTFQAGIDHIDMRMSGRVRSYNLQPRTCIYHVRANVIAQRCEEHIHSPKDLALSLRRILEFYHLKHLRQPSAVLRLILEDGVVEGDRHEIVKAIRQQIARGRYESSDLYGDGHAAEKIVDVLSRREFKLQKTITY